MKEETKIKLQNKFEEFKLNTKTKIKSGLQWCADNKEIVTFVAGSAMVAGKVIKSNMPTQAEKEEKWREKHYYDDSTRTWYSLRRGISEETRRQIYREQHDGRDLESILIERNLYKRER